MSLPTNCLAAIYHLPSSGTKEYPASADATTSGTLLPMDTYAHALIGGALQNPHELYIDAGIDLRVSDKVVIDSVTYFVKHVFAAENFGTLRHIRAALSTEK